SPQSERVVELVQGQPPLADSDGGEHLGVERNLVQRDTVMDSSVQVFVPHRVVLPPAAHTLYEVTARALPATWPIGVIPFAAEEAPRGSFPRVEITIQLMPCDLMCSTDIGGVRVK